MLAVLTLTQIVYLCLQDRSQGMSLMQLCEVSSTNRSNLTVLNTWSCHTKKTGLQNWELLHNRSSDKDWVLQWTRVFWTFRRSVRSNGLFLSREGRTALTVDDIQRGTKKERKLIERRKQLSRQNVSMLSKRGHVNSGNPTKLMCQCKKDLENRSPTSFHCSGIFDWKRKNQAEFP